MRHGLYTLWFERDCRSGTVAAPGAATVADGGVPPGRRRCRNAVPEVAARRPDAQHGAMRRTGPGRVAFITLDAGGRFVCRGVASPRCGGPRAAGVPVGAQELRDAGASRKSRTTVAKRSGASAWNQWPVSFRVWMRAAGKRWWM